MTTISELPIHIMKQLTCKLLHEKIPTWDGTYIWSEECKKNIPNIKWVCKEGCNDKK